MSQPGDQVPPTRSPEAVAAAEPTLLVGVDCGSKAHAICVLDSNGKQKQKFEIEHSVEGFAHLVSELLKDGRDPGTIAVAIEDPHHAVVEWLLERRLRVFGLNPKQLDRFRDRHSVAGAKDDSRDAYVLADSLRTDRHLFTALEAPTAAQRAMREASRRYDTLQRDFNRQTNRLYALLLRSAPNLLALCPAADEAFFFALLKLAPTQDLAKKVRLAQVQRVLTMNSKRKFTADHVLTVLRAPRLTLAPGGQEAIAKNLLSELRLLVPSHAEMVEMRNCLRELCRTAGRDAEILDSFPGAGEMVTAAFIGEAGQAIAARNLAQLRGLTGVAPVTRRSGKSHSVSMRRACNRRLRDASFYWARTAIVRDPVAKAQYQALRERGHTFARSLRSVADRLLSRLIGALKANTLYQPPPDSTDSTASAA